MPSGPLSDRIVSVFDSLPAQLQAAARYVLDRPREVALLSMREQARQAGVQPATMTRLAKALGLGGYDELRQAYADALRGEAAGFLGKRSEEHTSELQSLMRISYAVFCLKKKNQNT